MKTNNTLDTYRAEINSIDDQLLELLEKRMSVCAKVGEYKKKHALAPLDEKRWQEVLNKVIHKGTEKNLPASFIHELYTLIHTYSLKLQQTKGTKRTIGIQGGAGSFNEQAALTYTLSNNLTNNDIIYLYTTENVLKALSQGTIDQGIFAIHNSLGGMVHESLKAMGKYTFTFVDSVQLPIAHTLMIRKDAKLSDVTTIMSHPQTQLQCKQNLAEKYPRLKLTSGEGELIDHALVAKYLSEGKLDKHIATLGSRRLAELYDLDILEENLQDESENYTTFLIVESSCHPERSRGISLLRDSSPKVQNDTNH